MCVSDILNDEVKYHNVLRIDSGTCISTFDQLYGVMMSYDQYRWKEHSFHEAIQVVQRLLFDGKLSQQRRYGGKPDLSGGIWTTATDEDITWYEHTHPVYDYDSMEDVITDIVGELKDMAYGRHEKCFD